MSNLYGLLSSRLLLFSLAFIGVGIYFLLPYFKSQSELIPIRGHLETTRIDYIRHTHKGRTSTHAELTFTLRNDNHQFLLRDPNGIAFMDKEFDKLLRIVDTTAMYTVFIDRDEIAEVSPKVYQIDVGSETIVSFKEIQTRGTMAALMILVFGIILYAVHFLKIRRRANTGDPKMTSMRSH